MLLQYDQHLVSQQCCLIAGLVRTDYRILMNGNGHDDRTDLGRSRADAWHALGADDLFDESVHIFEVYHAQSNMTVRMEAEIAARFADLYASASLNRMVAEGSGMNAGLPRKVLPAPAASGLDFASVLSRRRTIREYSGDPIGLDIITGILWSSFGVTSRVRDAAGAVHSLRALPSGGGLYPLDAYLIPFRVNDLPSEIVYRFAPTEHALEISGLRVGRDQLGASLNGVYPKTWQTASAAFIVSGVFNRMTFKYGERGYRFVLFEAGAACSQVCLAATSLGLGGCWVGGYYDQKLNEMIGVDGVDQAVLGLVLIGGVTGSADNPVAE